MFATRQYEFVEDKSDQAALLTKKIAAYSAGKVIRSEPGSFLNVDDFKDFVENRLPTMKTYESDVFLSCFPKTGSTWMQEIVWNMIHNPNLDNPDDKKHYYDKALFLETDVLFSSLEKPPIVRQLTEKMGVDSFLDLCKKLNPPRIFKTHLFIDFFPKETFENSKFIYMIRNPLDTCVSGYHFYRSIVTHRFGGTLEDFVDHFLHGYHNGTYLEHLRHWWILRHNPNVLTIFYEDMKKNGPRELQKVNKFLNLDLNEQQLVNILDHTSFEKMSKRDVLKNKDLSAQIFDPQHGGGFFRKGSVGNSKSELTPELISKIKEHFRKNLGDIELPYDFSE